MNGYSVQYTTFYPASPTSGSTQAEASPVKCMVFIGLPDNPQFVGPQNPQRLAEHILRSRGPSGENREYLYNLCTALEELSPESFDEHVHDLTVRCRALEASQAQTLA